MTKSAMCVNVYLVNLGFEKDGKNFLEELYSILNRYQDSWGIMVNFIANQPFYYDPNHPHIPAGIYIVPMTAQLNLELAGQLAIMSDGEVPRYQVVLVYLEDCADINHPLYMRDSLTDVPWEVIEDPSRKTKWWKAFVKKFQRILEEYKKNWFEQYVCD
jgi:hypothetical protein